MITLEQYEQIRRMYHLEEKSARQIARELGCSRQTVSRALGQDQPPVYTMSKPRSAPVLGPYQVRLDALLQENKHLPKKQRYTSRKLFELIQAEGYAGSEAGVQMYAVRWRKAHKRPATFLPLEFEPGEDGQVDWGEAYVILKGEQQKVQVFVMHLSYSRRTFVMTFPAQKQEAFFYGHVRAFDFFGGVPHRLSYDNLSAAIKPLVQGRVREEQRAFIAFRSHYLFDSHFCTPAQGHEKGGVEGSVGFSRRNYLVPMPRVGSFEELNQQLLQRCLRDETVT
jgi:transposase